MHNYQHFSTSQTGVGWVLGNQVGISLYAKFWVHKLHPGEAIEASVSAIIDSMVKTTMNYYDRLLKINQIIMSMFNVVHTFQCVPIVS